MASIHFEEIKSREAERELSFFLAHRLMHRLIVLRLLCLDSPDCWVVVVRSLGRLCLVPRGFIEALALVFLEALLDLGVSHNVLLLLLLLSSSLLLLFRWGKLRRLFHELVASPAAGGSRGPGARVRVRSAGHWVDVL